MEKKEFEKAVKEQIENTIFYNIGTEEIDDDESNYEAGRRDAIYDFGEELFVAGADWRINSVWHTYEEAKEVDLGKENIVIVMYPNNIYKIGKLSLYQHKKTNPTTGLQEIVQEVVVEQPHNMVCLLSRCKGWAYVKDLIPNNRK